MPTIADNLKEIIKCKANIRTEIIKKHSIPTGDFRTYDEAIRDIKKILVENPIEILCKDFGKIGYQQEDVPFNYLQNITTDNYDKIILPLINETKPKFDIWNPTNISADKLYMNDTRMIIAPKIDLSNLSGERGWMDQMFEECVNLQIIPNYDFSKTISCYNTFFNCNKLKFIPENIIAPLCENSEYMFRDCHNIEFINEINMPKCQYARQMFIFCKNLHHINKIVMNSLSSFELSFSDCTKLEYIKEIQTTSALKNIAQMFDGCTNLLWVGDFDTSGCDNFSFMFLNCTNLLNAPLLDLSSAKNCNGMFDGCVKLFFVPAMKVSPDATFNNAFKDCRELEYFGGFINLKSDLNLSYCPNLTKESLIEILKNLGTANKKLILGTNLNKLNTQERAIATNKGWTLSVN